jgi:hypothetical protein
MTAVLHVPPHILRVSASDDELVLPYREALELVELARAARMLILGWEGWFRYPDGAVGHATYQGTVSLEDLTFWEAADLVASTIREDYADWSREPHEEELLFCITLKGEYDEAIA